ncbi:zinc finger and BTB domain-containing protein 9-like [Ochlerotatus camptorhynchus]|uniref:zinc finger and BTB domain-containing protein 9-like n=1 Tax=Ochlerotatus camptorhynchus TaxID=644619 RepID=UPI0031E2FC8F
MPLNDLQPLAFTTTNNFTMNHSSNSTIQPNPTQEQQFCLRWNNYHSNLSTVFDQLLQAESFVDVTLIGEGRPIKAHKMVLAASSPYFQTIFQETPCKHPVVIINDVKWEELKALVDFMYRGEINVAQEQIRPLLNLAQMFQIRGLTDVSHEDVESEPVRVTREASNVEQFTVYTASIVENIQQSFNSHSNDIVKRRSSKERDFARKQTLETLEVPVEWPKEEEVPATVESTSKNPRKRKSTSIDAPAEGNFIAIPLEQPPYIPPAISQPTTMVAPPQHPPPAPQLVFQSTFQPEDTDSKMNFLDSTNEGDDISFNNSQEWSSTTESRSKSSKAPAWNWNQLQEAITAVVTQRLRFTQASAQYNIPKGTLYDNILGKAHRMAVLQELALNPDEEAAVLNFCCDTATSPYNKRTKRSLSSILEFVSHFQSYREKGDRFKFGGKPGFRWWWAFCRKHSIVSLYYEGLKLTDDHDSIMTGGKKGRKSAEFDGMEAL